MSLLQRRVGLAALLALAVSFCFGATTYSHSVTNASSVTITSSQHGFSSKHLSVNVFDSTNTYQPPSTYSASINDSTYAVTVSWPGTQFTGTVKVIGTWPSSDTSASTDFEVTIGVGDAKKLDMGAAHSTANPARRTHSGKTYASQQKVTLTATSLASTTVRVYVEDQIVVFGVVASSGSASCSVSSGGCQIRYSISSFPSGVLQLAQATTNASSEFQSVTDSRPW